LKYNITHICCGCGHNTRTWMSYIALRRLKHEKSIYGGGRRATNIEHCHV